MKINYSFTPVKNETILTNNSIENSNESVGSTPAHPCNCGASAADILSSDQNLYAPPAQPCNCVPYSLLCCCGPQNGISIIQPSCQNLPDGSVVNNPAYVAQLNTSFWTYKFMTDCNSTTRAVSNFGIPVCQLINADNIIVSEKIDGCGDFTPVPFTLTTNDPNLGPAPAGFQFVKVETNGRYDKGVTVEYRLEISGDYPIAIQPITVKAANNILVFDCGCFQVPQCNPQGKLSLTKECGFTIINNQAILNYHLTVSNIGDGTLANVLFNDIITIPTNLNVGTITVTPSTLTVNTGTPGQIIISGNLGTLVPGGQVIIDYTIQITGVSAPGSYIISNTASASAAGTQASANCFMTIDAVQVNAQKCCIVSDSNTGTYRVTIASVGSSPDTLVDVFDNLFIPGGITLQFTGFDGCIATFANTGTPVPLFTNITGPIRINISCNSLLVPASSTVHKNITFVLISSSSVGIAVIENAIETITPTIPDSQIFLGAGNLPLQVNMIVELSLQCTNPCS